MANEYTDNEQDRLWAHRLHEDLIFYERHSFFLVTQSLLVVAYAELLPSEEDFAATVLAVAGALLTTAWLMVSHRQREIIAHVQSRAQASLREFGDTYEQRPRARPGATTLMAVAVPASLGVIWILLFVIAVA